MKVINKKQQNSIKGGMDAVTAAARQVTGEDYGWDWANGDPNNGPQADYNGIRGNR